MEPFDLTGVKEYASEIAQPLRDRLVEDICRRVKEAGAITTTAEYEIYRAEQLGLAEKEIKAAIAEQSGINAGAVDMLFGDILDKTVRFEDNGQLQQLAAAYKRITTQGANRLLKNLWAPVRTASSIPSAKPTTKSWTLLLHRPSPAQRTSTQRCAGPPRNW